MAHHKLNVESKRLHDAFIQGFYSVIKYEWISSFSEREFQSVISGTTSTINVADWKEHCVYSGGYLSSSQPVVWFWQLVEHELSENERAMLLRFATACTRPPLLGFSSLDPKFQIQRTSSSNGQLPSSSTCFNTLKLPAYGTRAVLKEKLLKAINSGSGFELS